MNEGELAIVASILMASMMHGKEHDFPTHARRAVQAAKILITELHNQQGG